MDLLESGIRQLGIYHADKLDTLKRYIEELELWNTKHNLVRAKGDDLIIRHILDSLSGYQYLRALTSIEKIEGEKTERPRIADIGSGAGLPGIPLAVWLDTVNCVLVEKSEKRCGFLRNVKALCRLDNCSVVCSQIEDVTDFFDICVFRALGEFAEYAGKIEKVIKPQGRIAAYKGKKASIKPELQSISRLWSVEEIHEMDVPFLKEERHLVVLQYNP